MTILKYIGICILTLWIIETIIILIMLIVSAWREKTKECSYFCKVLDIECPHPEMPCSTCEPLWEKRIEKYNEHERNHSSDN